MYHIHVPLLYTENMCILAVNGEKMLQSRYICIYACNRHWKSDNMHACHSVTDESIRKRTADLWCTTPAVFISV